jgi:hypothetical protein
VYPSKPTQNNSQFQSINPNRSKSPKHIQNKIKIDAKIYALQHLCRNCLTAEEEAKKRASKLKTKELKTAERIFNAMCTQKENKICSIYIHRKSMHVCGCQFM